jgi:GntR family transcriptional regulator
MTTYYDCRRIIRQDGNAVGVSANPPSAALSRSSPEPLYRQLATALENAIRSGALKPGARLDSEGVLAERYDVSRITLRQAVEALVRKQMLVRKQGKGTFVITPAVRHDLKRLHGLLGSLFSQAEGASARLLRYELRAPPVDVGEILALAPRTKALALERLYLIDNNPVAFTEAWLVPAVAELPRLKAELISTEDMMRAVGITIASTQVAIRAEAAGARVGRLLKITARTPVLGLHRKAIGADGTVKEAGRVWFCSDSYQFVCSTQNAGPVESVFDIQNVGEQV